MKVRFNKTGGLSLTEVMGYPQEIYLNYYDEVPTIRAALGAPADPGTEAISVEMDAAGNVEIDTGWEDIDLSADDARELVYKLSKLLSEYDAADKERQVAEIDARIAVLQTEREQLCAS